jgi:hypothetical protein
VNWQTADEEPEPEPTFRIRPYLEASPSAEAADDADKDGADPIPTAEADGARGLRPFVLTSGRVSAVDPAISLETQVTARLDGTSWAAPPLSRLSPELQNIIALCGEPMSVAEISARLRLHLGVTKVLVGDLRVAGHLDVHICDVEGSHDPDIILRVIDGLRAIS